MQDKNPIVLCHAACTGGSLIYRLIVLSFGFVGLSELSHKYNYSCTDFLPFDPEAQLYLQGIIDKKKFSDTFFERIVKCNNVISESGKTMLIREHSHSYFFSEQTIVDGIASISWIAGQYKKIYKDSLQCLLSVRDPIDSWLGLRQNFPKERNMSLDKYCEKYLIFLNLSEKTENLYIFKYENMVTKAQDTLSEISSKINYPVNISDLEMNNSIYSSGNSGRRSSDIYIRPRRPFTNNLIDTARRSARYAELCERLGYEHLENQIKLIDKVYAIKNQANNFLYIMFNFFKRKKINYIFD